MRNWTVSLFRVYIFKLSSCSVIGSSKCELKLKERKGRKKRKFYTAVGRTKGSLDEWRIRNYRVRLRALRDLQTTGWRGHQRHSVGASLITFFSHLFRKPFAWLFLHLSCWQETKCCYFPLCFFPRPSSLPVGNARFRFISAASMSGAMITKQS